MRSALPFSLVSLIACSVGGRGDYTNALSSIPEEVARTVAIRIDVIPSDLRGADGDNYRVLPQSLLPGFVPVGSPLDIGSVNLISPVVQSGTLSAFRVNPSISSLPGESLPLPGTVQLRYPQTIQWYSTRTDDLGNFSLWSIPGSYELEIVPDDPLLPMFSGSWTVSDPTEPISLDLEAGVPIYGQVLSSTGPVAGARVHIEDSDGVQSASAVADAYGIYQVRVSPGTWTIVSEGRGSGTDPILRFEDLDVGLSGLNHNVVYPADLSPSSRTYFLQGQILDPEGDLIQNATVRVIADTIDGYEDLDAHFEASDSTDSGGFIVSVVPGSYTIEVMPPNEEYSGALLTPIRISDVRIDETVTTLDPLSFTGSRTLTGNIRGPNSASLGSARIDCTEEGFDGRTWFAFAKKGEFSIEVSDVALECRVDPPADRTDLARVWRAIEPGQDQYDFDLPIGEKIYGTVLTDGVPEAFVVVDVLDSTGRSLGSGLTLEDGAFSIPVDLDSAK